MLLDQAPQRLDGGVGRRPASPRRCGRGSPPAAPPRSRSAPAGPASPGESPRAPESPPRAGRGTGSTAARSRRRWPSGITGSAASCFNRFSASPERSPSASATSSVKLTTQPSVASAWKRNPCAVVGGTRIAPGAANGRCRCLERHLAAALLDQQDLKQVAMPVRADQPVVHRRARGNRLDMDEIERLIVRWIAVQMKQRQCRHRGHGARIGQRQRLRNLAGANPAWGTRAKRRGPAVSGGAPGLDCRIQ